MISKGFGLEAAQVSERENLSDALDKMLSSDKGYVLEVIVEKEENVFPMVPAGTSVSQIRLK